MDGFLLNLVIAAIASLPAVAGSFFVARRYRQMGGGLAQTKLNRTLTELNEVLDARLKISEAALIVAQARIGELEIEIKSYRRDRMMFQNDIDDLHAELRLARKSLFAEKISSNGSDGNGIVGQ